VDHLGGFAADVIVRSDDALQSHSADISGDGETSALGEGMMQDDAWRSPEGTSGPLMQS